MIIALEGLSCAGKSAVSTELSLRYSEKLIFLPEFLLQIDGNTNTDLCIANDVAKSSYATLLLEKGSTILMDRSYMSTLVYTYAEGREKYAETQRWYKKAIEKGFIRKPDFFIYLRVQPAKSLERAATVNRLNNKYAWYNNTVSAYNKYEDFFSKNNLNIPHFAINVDNMNLNQLIIEVENALRQVTGLL